MSALDEDGMRAASSNTDPSAVAVAGGHGICHAVPMWTARDVVGLRERLGVDHPTFARMVGVDTRTVFRWEAGIRPTGAAEAVLSGIREKLASDPRNADRTIDFLVKSAAIGGLTYLFVQLLDAATAGAPRARRGRQRPPASP